MVFLLTGHLQHVALGDGRRTPMDNLDVEVDMIDLRKSTRTDAPSVDQRVGERETLAAASCRQQIPSQILFDHRARVVEGLKAELEIYRLS